MTAVNFVPTVTFSTAPTAKCAPVKITPSQTQICIEALQQRSKEVEADLAKKTKHWKNTFNYWTKYYNTVTQQEYSVPLEKRPRISLHEPQRQTVLVAKQRIVEEQDAQTQKMHDELEALKKGVETLSQPEQQPVSEVDVKTAAAVATPKPISDKLAATIKKTIFVYNGIGAEPFCVDSAKIALQENMDPTAAEIKEFASADGLPEKMDLENDVVLIPGGAFKTQLGSLFRAPFDKTPLTLAQNRLVDFFKHGNTLGICAGASLVTSSIDHDLRRGLEYTTKYDFYKGFLPIKSAIPLEPYFTFDNVLNCDVKLITVANRTFASYYCLGPWFIRPEKLPEKDRKEFHSFSTMATYSDEVALNADKGKPTAFIYHDSEMPAVIEWHNPEKNAAGKHGRVVLSGNHTEVTAAKLQTIIDDDIHTPAEHEHKLTAAHKERLNRVIKQLSGPHAIQSNRLLFRSMIEKVGISLKPL